MALIGTAIQTKPHPVYAPVVSGCFRRLDNFWGVFFGMAMTVKGEIPFQHNLNIQGKFPKTSAG
jgi:hypothetical protein